MDFLLTSVIPDWRERRVLLVSIWSCISDSLGLGPCFDLFLGGFYILYIAFHWDSFFSCLFESMSCPLLIRFSPLSFFPVLWKFLPKTECSSSSFPPGSCQREEETSLSVNLIFAHNPYPSNESSSEGLSVQRVLSFSEFAALWLVVLIGD